MLKQPITQVRLTNVATVRCRRHGKRYELACYKNKILNWRSGAEADISEVLQTDAIFQNVSKGQLAKMEDLEKSFGTRDSLTIAKYILEHGELQVSDKERDVMTRAVFKDVCTLVADRIFSRQTHLPLTVSMVETALTTVGFSVSMDIAPKRQMLKAVEVLMRSMPSEIARSQMLLHIVYQEPQKDQVQKFLASDEIRAMIRSLDDSTSRMQETSNISVVKMKTQDLEVIDARKAEDQKEGSETTYSASPLPFRETFSQSQKSGTASLQSVTFYCNPTCYRDIDHFVTTSLDPPGSLHIMSAREHVINVNDNEKQQAFEQRSKVPASPVDRAVGAHSSSEGVAASVQSRAVQARQRRPKREKVPQAKKNLASQNSKMTDKEAGGALDIQTQEPTRENVNVTIGCPSVQCNNEKELTTVFIRCRVCCNTPFPDSSQYRAHCRTPWHGFNLKRRVKNLPPVDQAEFDDFEEDVRQGFLAVDG